MGICLETKNWEGKRVVFEESRRAAHESKHPELTQASFIQGQVKRAIEAPECVYRDFERPDERMACYIKEFEVNGIPRYTKVVIDFTTDPYQVKTVFRPTAIKEKNRNCELLYGKPI